MTCNGAAGRYNQGVAERNSMMGRVAINFNRRTILGDVDF